ncbi:hypothetical protein GCM10025783_23410 [Amnibacterium soli]|uniref:Uncharacterized protein n=1 Tax=Amnibacterium soli TaxID=1282736 RepID=A0ABP8Z982_9MICO
MCEGSAFHKLEGCRSSSTPPSGGESATADRTAPERPAAEEQEADMSTTLVEPVVLLAPRPRA